MRYKPRDHSLRSLFRQSLIQPGISLIVCMTLDAKVQFRVRTEQLYDFVQGGFRIRLDRRLAMVSTTWIGPYTAMCPEVSSALASEEASAVTVLHCIAEYACERIALTIAFLVLGSSDSACSIRALEGNFVSDAKSRHSFSLTGRRIKPGSESFEVQTNGESLAVFNWLRTRYCVSRRILCS